MHSHLNAKSFIAGLVLGVAAMVLALPTFFSRAATVPPADHPKPGSQPVYLLVMVDDFNRSAFKPYQDALRTTGIITKNGGEYLAVGAPAQLLEGDWPKSRSFVLEKFPSMADFKNFWFSDEYQKKIKPLRDNTGKYTIAVFESPQTPPPTGAK